MLNWISDSVIAALSIYILQILWPRWHCDCIHPFVNFLIKKLQSSKKKCFSCGLNFCFSWSTVCNKMSWMIQLCKMQTTVIFQLVLRFWLGVYFWYSFSKCKTLNIVFPKGIVTVMGTAGCPVRALPLVCQCPINDHHGRCRSQCPHC